MPTLGATHAAETPLTDGKCASLTSSARPGLEILSAAKVPAGHFPVADNQGFQIPGSCRLVGIARPTADSRIRFELWLPDHWNGRYSQLGNGGFAGNIDQPSLANEIRRGNAAAMTDTGHKAGQFDASWAAGHPQKVVDYGYRSIKITSDAARKLIAAYYGRSAQRRYYIGCSNGGRQALMAAQRYPYDWDGVIAGSPAVYWTKQLAAFAAIQHRLRSRAANWIPAEKLPLIERAAVAACAPQQALCKLDPRVLRCGGKDAPNCLTAEQAVSLKLIQSGPGDPRGRPLFFGFDPRAAAWPDSWATWILNPDRSAPSDLAFATQAYRYLITDQQAWEVEQFDAVRGFGRASQHRILGQRLSTILDPDSTNLQRFASRGGKLIMYVGLSDPVVAPGAALDYYDRAVKRLGSIAKTHRFFRLFVIPGMQHCQGGLAPNSLGQAWVAPALVADPQHDIRLAMESWVERGRSPASLDAVEYTAPGRAQATQKIFPYPAAAGPIRTVP